MIVSSYKGSKGNSTISSLVPKMESKTMFSSAIKAHVYCTLRFFIGSLGRVKVHPRRHQFSRELICLLTAPYRISLIYSRLRQEKTRFQVKFEFARQNDRLILDSISGATLKEIVTTGYELTMQGKTTQLDISELK